VKIVRLDERRVFISDTRLVYTGEWYLVTAHSNAKPGRKCRLSNRAIYHWDECYRPKTGTYPTKGQRILRWAVERWEKDNRMTDDDERAELLDTLSDGIMDRMDIDTNATHWAEGALDALLKRGYKITKE
jgi:hypothetical protein